MRLFGALLRSGYSVYKKKALNSKNKAYFEVLETFGKGIRTALEEESGLENIYEGSDVIRAGEEFYKIIKKA